MARRAWFASLGQRKVRLSRSLFLAAVRLRREHATKTVNHISLVAVDHVAIGGLHFRPLAGGPGAASQDSPIAP